MGKGSVDNAPIRGWIGGITLGVAQLTLSEGGMVTILLRGTRTLIKLTYFRQAKYIFRAFRFRMEQLFRCTIQLYAATNAPGRWTA